MRILIVEDEKKVLSFLKRGLEGEGYAVDGVGDGVEGENLASINDYDLIILDIMLPGKNGFDILRGIRAQKIMSPVLLLTARDSTEDKVTGLDIGADDYLTKPFSYDEFIARVRALLRRGTAGAPAEMSFAGLALNPHTHKAEREGKEIELTAKEYSLLDYFLRNSERVLTRAMIAEHVWNLDFDSYSNVIDVFINHLRNKVDKGFSKKLFHTVRGVGYILKEKKE